MNRRNCVSDVMNDLLENAGCAALSIYILLLQFPPILTVVMHDWFRDVADVIYIMVSCICSQSLFRSVWIWRAGICEQNNGRWNSGETLLRFARVFVWPLWPNAGRIIASNFYIVLESIFIAVYNCGCVFENRLDLRLLVFVEPWSSQELKCSCIVPINVWSDPSCIRHEQCIIVCTVDFSLCSSAKKFFTANITVEPVWSILYRSC